MSRPTNDGAGAPPLWRTADWALLVVSLAAVIAGSFPEWFLPSHIGRSLAAPPALSVLLAAQAGFVLALCPMLLAPRAGRGLGRYLAGTVGEYVLLLVASIPLYLVAAWLSDARAADVIRPLIYLTTVALGAWGLGVLVRTGRTWAACAAAFVALLGVVAAPAVHYLMLELADAPPSLAWLWHVGPVTNAFALARPAAGVLPEPIWPCLLWPCVGLVAALIAAVAGRAGDADGPPAE